MLDTTNGALFDTAGSLLSRVSQEVQSMFAVQATASQITGVARRYGIDILVVQDTDPGWHSAAWGDRVHFRLVAHCEFARAYQRLEGAP